MPDRIFTNAPASRQLPRLTGSEKGAGRQIRGVKANAELLSMQLVELGVGAHPAGVGGGPEFTDPVILEGAGREVSGKAAADTGRDRLMSQHAAMHDRVVAACAKERFSGRRFARSDPGNKLWVCLSRSPAACVSRGIVVSGGMPYCAAQAT